LSIFKSWLSSSGRALAL